MGGWPSALHRSHHQVPHILHRATHPLRCPTTGSSLALSLSHPQTNRSQHITSKPSQIRLERDGFPVNRSAIKGCIEVYRSLTDSPSGSNIYKHELEPHILAETSSYYKHEGSTLITTCDAPTYLLRAEARLQSEHERAAHYFRVTEEGIVRLVKMHLLTPHLGAVLGMQGSGLDNMIDAFASASSSGVAQQPLHDAHGRGGGEDLSRLYALFTLVPEGLPVLKKALKESIAERGRAVNEAEGSSGDVDVNVDEDAPNPLLAETKSAKGKGKERASDSNPLASALPSTPAEGAKEKASVVPGAAAPGKKTLDAALKWVQDVLDLKDVFDRLLKGCFRDDKGVQTAMNEVRFLFSFALLLECCLEEGRGTDVRIGIRVVYQLTSQSTRVHLALHRREPQERSQRRTSPSPSPLNPPHL